MNNEYRHEAANAKPPARIKNKVARCLFSLSLLCLAGPLSAQTTAVTFVTDEEKDGGFLIAVTDAAFKKVGYKVQIQYRPWARALKSVMDGDAEALLGVYRNDERAAQMLYTESIGSSDLVFFKLKSSTATFQRLEDLKNLSVGTVIGASYTPEFNAAAYIKKESTSEVAINLRKLLASRIDLLLEKRAVVQDLLSTQFAADASRIVALDTPLKTALFYNAFSKKIPGYATRVADFNRGLALIKQDGTFKEIMERKLHE
ncbi:MAG: ABC-type amino acid transport/signal transduction system, periplasmic component/domain [Proteobacteria bacterium]|nr:ABC-type amino acid transport/signal transduction system, periplasmic component/domain [Pseudomonadota bacterium]